MLSNAWGTDSPSGLIIANVVLITIASYFCSIVVFQLDELNIWRSRVSSITRPVFVTSWKANFIGAALGFNCSTTQKFFLSKYEWGIEQSNAEIKAQQRKRQMRPKIFFAIVLIASSNKLRIVFMAPPPPNSVAFIGFSSTHESSPQATAYRSPQY